MSLLLSFLLPAPNPVAGVNPASVNDEPSPLVVQASALSPSVERVLPSRSGEPFFLRFAPGTLPISEISVIEELLPGILPAVGWRAGFDALKLRDGLMLPAVDHLPLRTQYNFAQVFDGVELENYGVVVVVDAMGVRSISGALVTNPHIGNHRPLSSREAEEIAAQWGEPRSSSLVARMVGEVLLQAWKVDLGARWVWVDAETGEILAMEDRFWSVSATGMTWEPDPAGSLVERSFEVDPQGSAGWSLRRDGILGVVGPDTQTVTLSSQESPDFRLDVEDPRFPEVALYSQLWSDLRAYADWGATALPLVVAQVGGACLDGSAACAGEQLVFGDKNAAMDATVVSHELAHLLVNHQFSLGGGRPYGAVAEGVADFLAVSRHDTDTVGAWLTGGEPVETGELPRRMEAEDVFPVHLERFGNDPHSSGQILARALLASQEGTKLRGADIEPLLVDALGRSGLGNRLGTSEEDTYRAFQEVLLQLLESAGSSQEAVALLQGFARAGIFTSAQEAVIAPDTLWLDPKVRPTFTIWSGESFVFEEGTAIRTSPLNDRFVVEVASDPDFQLNDWVSEPMGGLWVDDNGVASRKWTVPAAVWARLRTQPQVYYRVTTMSSHGGSVRSSTHYAAEAMSLPPAEASFAPEQSIGCSSAPGPMAGWFMGLLVLLRRKANRR